MEKDDRGPFTMLAEMLGKFFEEVYQRLDHSHKEIHQRFDQLNRRLVEMEEQMSTENQALARLQGDMTNLQKQLADLQNALNAAVQAQTDANARLDADIEALRSAAGSGNADTINAIADSLESTLTAQQSIVSNLQDNATAESTLDVAVVISPATGNCAPGATIQFSANVPVNWGAQVGSIDRTGLYTAPASPATDVVTAIPAPPALKVTAPVTIA